MSSRSVAHSPRRTKFRCSYLILLAALAMAFLSPAPGLAATADEIHWTITGPDSVSFDWRGTANTISYGLAANSYTDTVTAYKPTPLPYSSSGPFWEARIKNLQPDTLYHYSIGGSADATFHTAPLPGAANFTIFADGDIGDSKTYPQVTSVQNIIAAGKPDFAFQVGDLSYANAHGQTACDTHFNDVMAWSRSAAYMPTWGNHEWDSSTDNLQNYKGRFDFPNPQTSPGISGVNGGGEDWYWFDYGNTRFIIYPEPYSSTSWTDWTSKATALMDEAQADPAIQFIVTAGHRPAYSSGHHAGSSTLANILGKLGASHGKYVLNLNGHSHNYERTYAQSGVTHITVGTGGGSLEEDGSCKWLICSKPSWSAFRAFHYGALKLAFTSTAITGSFICGASSSKDDVTCAQGSTLDSFVIKAPTAPTDTQPPTISITSPSSGATVSGKTTTLAASASDNVGVTKVAFYSGNTLLGSASNSSGSTWQYSWDSTGTANGTYTLTARAYDAAGNVTTSASVLVTVSNTAADTTPPSVSITSPTKGATVSGTTALTVTATDNLGVTKVAFYDGSSLLGTATSSSGSTWQYSWNTSSAANGGCSLTAKAYDASGNCGTSASISVTVSNSTSDTTPPSTPANLKATASSSSQINLTWSASTDNVGVTGYNVYRNGTMLTKTTTASYSNTGLAASTSYTYTVAAVDAAGNVSSQSASASATTLSSSAQSQTLKFTPVGDAVIKSPYPSSNYGSDTKLWLQATPEYDSLIQFTVSGIGSAAVTSAKLYLYNFRSSTSGGKFYAAGSSWSESKVTWSNAPAAGTLIATLGTVPGSSWVAVDVTSLIKGDGTYSIRAVPAAGSVIGYYSKEMSGYVPYLMVTTGGGSSADTTSPSTPANLKTTAGSSSQIDLSWSASTDNVAVTGYNVYRDGSLLTKTSTTSFSDSGLTPSTSYSYTVAALDAAGNASGQCAPVSGTTLDAALNPVTLTFAPVADAHIQAAHPSSNYGSAAKVWVQASPEYDFLMKFAVSGIGTKKVTSAKLRLYCVHGDAAGGDFYSTGSGWTESGVTWNNAPSTGDLINTLGSAASSSWVEVDVASLITGDGTFSLRALPAAGTVVGYDSREAPGFAPELVVTAE
jgi:chitodextrinase